MEIEVQFEISADGIVSVSAKDLETGLPQSITVTATSGLTEEEIQRMAAEAEEYAVGVKEDDAVSKRLAEVEARLRDLRTILSPKIRMFMGTSEFGRDALTKVDEVRRRGEKAIGARHKGELESIQAPLDRALRMLRGVAEKMGDDGS